MNARAAQVEKPNTSGAKPDFVPPQNVVEIRTISQALKLLDDWEAAYDELRRDYTKLHAQYTKAIFWAAVHKTGEQSNWVLYEAALTGDDELRAALLAQIRAESLPII